MKKFEFSVSMNLVGCQRTEIVELDDDITEEELQEMYAEWRDEQLDGGWAEVE